MAFRVGDHSYEFPNGGSIDFFERRVAAAASASELLCKLQNEIINIVSRNQRFLLKPAILNQ
jgi:hypothetical protein